MFDDDIKQPEQSVQTYILVLGNSLGIDEIRTRNSEKTQTLKKLVIKWSHIGEEGTPIDVHLEDTGVKYSGDLCFTNQWENKYFDITRMTWYFLDANGTLVKYHLASKEIQCIPLANQGGQKCSK